MSQITKLTPSSGPGSGTVTSVSGGNNITITGVPTVNPTVNVSGTTNHAILLGNATGSINSLAVATNGQLPIGSTGADPVLATLTAGSGITITNGAGSITIASGSAVAESFPTNSGTATPSAGVLNIFGDSHNITTTGSGNTVTVGLTGITQHSLQVGGASEALTQLGVATNGQLPIGSTGADPVLATITAGTGISVTNGAGSITIATTGSTNPVTTLHTQDGNNVTATAGVINISGGNSLTTTGTAGPNTATISLTGITQYNVQTGGASNALNNVAPSATSGVPLISQGAASQPIFGTAVVAGGGTGDVSFTAYAPICGGTTTTGALQSASTGLGSSGFVLTSNGSAALPSFQAVGASSISITGDSGGALTGNAFTFTGGTTGLTFAGAGTTETLGGTLVVSNGGTGRTTLTNHGLLVGAGTAAITQLADATNRQLPIGSAGADPVLATLTAGGGISITNGAGSITIAATGTTSFNYTNVNTTPYVVLITNDYLSVDSSGGAITVQLPNAPALGQVFIIKDRTGSAATHNITVTTVGGLVNIDGATSFVMNTAYEAIQVIGNGSTYEVF